MKRNRVWFFLGALVALVVAVKVLRSPDQIQRPEREDLSDVRAETAPVRKAKFFTAAQSNPREPGGNSEGTKHHAEVAAGPKVKHHPHQPKSGEPVVVTVDFKDLPVPTDELLLEYQIVDPGKYIARRDPAFEQQWVRIPLAKANDSGGSKTVFQTQLPGDLQVNRRLMRYRVRNTTDNKVIAPAKGDAQPNFAYFVYNGVPDWKGAINPAAGDPKLSQPVTYPGSVLERVPVYHLISSKRAVEGATWKDGDQYGGQERNAYKYTGTMVYEGVVYDHIGFRARGGSWRHAMGKNMWKFNFLPGHRFEARDNYGNPYNTKWDKLNLGACIQQGDYNMRGEQGMFESLGFRLFNLAGLEASKTHFVHFRIIDQAEEAPSNQYAGDFWGLYLAVENVDEHFLKEHDLPPGNLYKMDFGAKTAFNGDPGVTDQSDVNQFLDASSRQQVPNSWWLNNLDLNRYFDYRSIIECIHHYDVDAGKNYFYYRNPKSHRWVVVPWDLDLTWGDQMFGAGQEPFYRAGILFRAPFKQQYQERLAELRDLLFNPEEVNRLIDEYATKIWDPAGNPSLVGADRAKWDFNPVLASRYAMPMKAGQGKFYFGNPRNTFATMVSYMKSYVAKRSKWIDNRLLSDYHPPAAPRISELAKVELGAPNFDLHLDSKAEASTSKLRWRLAEVTVTNSPAFDPHQPWKYEIESLWDQESADPQADAKAPTRLLAAGHTYRVRARWLDAGTWSRWSAPVQFTVPSP
jgi:hypothetical protein